MSDSHPNEVPEFAQSDHAARRRELAAAGTRAHEHLDKLKQNLKLPTLVGVETEAQPLGGGPNVCPERVRVLRLLTGPDQRILKEVWEQWGDDSFCYQTKYTFGIQLMGYGSYCMSFEKDPNNTKLFGNFFRDVSAYGVNLNRTMLFLKETYENQNAANIHRLLLDGNATNATVNPQYLANLNRFVVEAKLRGVVVQVCLFMHHAVVASSNCDMPKPVVLSGTPHDRYRSFFNTQSPYQQTQINFIDAVVRQLLPHWNVVYEIGNELRVPNPVATYNDSHLKAWIDWVAARIRNIDAGHLISVSTGIENEALINSSPRIQFCSFHQGQWVGKMDAACDKGKNYGNKHVVFDDDGGRRPLETVRAWSKAALNVRGGCRVSFNHKGPTLGNAYDPNWINQCPPATLPDIGRPVDVLNAFRDARNISTSPCARSDWH